MRISTRVTFLAYVAALSLVLVTVLAEDSAPIQGEEAIATDQPIDEELNIPQDGTPFSLLLTVNPN